jgi:ABC-2 type transport system ATP-binding protein
MSDIPYRVLIESDKTRQLGAALLDHELVFSVTVDNHKLHVETSDLTGLGSLISGLAHQLDTRLSLFAPEDESLESVFRYLVGGR